MTPVQKEIARHMLGLPNKPSNKSYRWVSREELRRYSERPRR